MGKSPPKIDPLMKLAPIMKLTGRYIVSSIIKFTLALFELFWIPISKEINKNIFDWSFENPGWFDKAKIPCANYITISYDSALRVSEKYGEKNKYINKTLWSRYFIANFFSK